ncbi:MAG: heavy-metal-associated domain-containing protein [Verrucomicrobia bacterium]|nr:heavy-metal-associated domain-containing protein [Verrucomicrobiota bacterium]
MQSNFRKSPFCDAVLGALLVLASLVWIAPDACAEFTSVKVKVNGLACPLCAYGLEKKLSQVAGVTNVSTDLKSGTVNLSLTKGASVSVRSLDEAVRRAGFTLESVSVTAVGALKVENNRLLLSVSHSPQKFLIFEASAREEQVHSGKQTRLLGDATQSDLERLRQEGGVVAVTGKIHDHTEGPARLSVEKYEAVK